MVIIVFNLLRQVFKLQVRSGIVMFFVIVPVIITTDHPKRLQSRMVREASMRNIVSAASTCRIFCPDPAC
jgi:hypothetical protein